MGVLLIVAVEAGADCGLDRQACLLEELQTIARGWSVTKRRCSLSRTMPRTKRSGMSMTSSSRPIVRARMPSLAWGDFWSAGERQVAVPANHLKHTEGRIVLPGCDERGPARPCRHSIREIKDASAASAVESVGNDGDYWRVF